MWELSFLIIGFAVGHYVSPWLDEQICALRQWIDPQPIDDYDDWTHR